MSAYVSNSRYSNEIDASDGDTPQVWFQVAADEGTAAYTSHDINGHLFADKLTLSQSNIEAIRKWHGKCCLHHERCNRTLSQCDSIDVDLAQLPTTEGARGKYIILSHRWGLDTFTARTTKDDYEYRCTQGVGCDTPNGVTPLFYEAGQLAFKLGVRHIWIDSVCIV